MAKNKKKGNQQNNAKPSAPVNSDNKPKSKQTSEKQSDSTMKNIAIAALVILLLLAGIGFLIFGLVQSVGNDDNDGDNKTETTDNNDDKDNDNKGSVNGDAASDSDNDDQDDDKNNDDTDDNNGSNPTGNRDISSANAGRFPTTNVAYRRGNDYKFGDIKGDSYTVRRGDTLWQIAEARYGSGYAWTEINKANGNFRNLPNGKPVLIRSGQTIILPEL